MNAQRVGQSLRMRFVQILSVNAVITATTHGHMKIVAGVVRFGRRINSSYNFKTIYTCN